MFTPIPITHAAPGRLFKNEYATMSPFNADNSLFLIAATDHFQLYSGFGSFIEDLPIAANQEPRWSKTDPHRIYFVRRNSLMALVVGNVANAHAVYTEHVFTEYQAISGKGESDISEDGQHFVLCGENRDVFVYSLATGKGPTFPLPDETDSLYITPDNNVLCGTLNAGVMMFSSTGQSLGRATPTISHMDVSRDDNGDEVLIRCNAGDPAIELQPGCPNGIELVRLRDKQRRCLWAVGYSPLGGPMSYAAHVSCPNRGFALVSIFAPQNTALPMQIWKVPFAAGATRELIANTGGVYRNYESQPHSSISRDGSVALYSVDDGTAVNTWLVRMTPSSSAGLTRIPLTAFGGKRYHLILNPDGTFEEFVEG